MTFVVVGGGPTRVDSIGELDHNVIARDFHHIEPRTAKIILIEAGDRLLAGFTPDLSQHTRVTLEKMGVDVITGAFVSDRTQGAVALSNGGMLECCCTLWAVGVRGTPAAKWVGAQADRAGRILVDDYLRVPPHQSIFAMATKPQRAKIRCCFFETSEAQGGPGLAVLECGPRLLSDWIAKQASSRRELGLGRPDIPARCPAGFLKQAWKTRWS